MNEDTKQRFVLIVEYNGNYEYGGYTDILPIKHHDNDTAYVEILDIISRLIKDLKEYHERSYLWNKNRPNLPKPPSKHPLSLKKHEKAIAKFKEDQQLWINDKPKIVSDEFVFCGHTLCAAEIFDVKVLTLDEWFYVAEAFDAKVMTLEEWHDRLSKS